MADYTPKPEHKFTFGLWTVGNRGRDPFGDFVRPPIPPTRIVQKLSDLGAWGVNLHDNDLVPIDATPAERDRIVREFKKALEDYNMRLVMGTTNLFYDPVFKDGAFTSNDPKVRACALQKSMHAIDLAVELGAEIYVFWGGREGTETDAAKDPVQALQWYRECMNFLIHYVKDQGYNLRFALEPKPNEPRGDIFLPTVGAMLAFIETLDDPSMCGVNPEVAHETMTGLNFVHAVAQAIERNKLFHIDLNAQKIGRYDQDYRFGAEDIKGAFFLVKLLEDNGYSGPRHFDAHAYRTEDEEGVWEFAKGCMRTYLILKEKVEKPEPPEEEPFTPSRRHKRPPRTRQPQPCVIESVRWQGDRLIIKLEGFDTITHAENLRGAWLLIPPEERMPLGEDEYYIDDLIGMEVLTEAGERVGKLKRVIPGGVYDYYEIGKYTIPAVGEYILEVDVPRKRMVVRLPEI